MFDYNVHPLCKETKLCVTLKRTPYTMRKRLIHVYKEGCCPFFDEGMDMNQDNSASRILFKIQGIIASHSRPYACLERKGV